MSDLCNRTAAPCEICEAVAVYRLRILDFEDPEKAHREADDILLSIVPIDVRLAYEDIVKRTAWWYSA